MARFSRLALDLVLLCQKDWSLNVLDCGWHGVGWVDGCKGGLVPVLALQVLRLCIALFIATAIDGVNDIAPTQTFTVQRDPYLAALMSTQIFVLVSRINLFHAL